MAQTALEPKRIGCAAKTAALRDCGERMNSLLGVVNTNDTHDPIWTVKNVVPCMVGHSRQSHYTALFSQVPGGWSALGLITWHPGELACEFNAPERVMTHDLLDLVIDPVT